MSVLAVECRTCVGSEDVMTINRSLGSVVVAGVLGAGLAGPASADPPAPQTFDGTYTYSGPAVANGPNITTQWVPTPCGAGCANVAVAPAAGQAGFSAQAQRGYRGWSMTHQGGSNALVGNDGHRGVGNITYRWAGTQGTISGQASSWVRDVPPCSDTSKFPYFGF